MKQHAAEIACAAQKLERALDVAHDERPELRAVAEAGVNFGGTKPPSIEAVEDLLRRTSPWGTKGDLLLCSAFYICCAMEGALVLPSFGNHIDLFLYGATVLIDEHDDG